MVQQVTTDTAAEFIYPESDGQPMSDNTIQFNWIVRDKYVIFDATTYHAYHYGERKKLAMIHNTCVKNEKIKVIVSLNPSVSSFK